MQPCAPVRLGLELCVGWYIRAQVVYLLDSDSPAKQQSVSGAQYMGLVPEGTVTTNLKSY